MKKFFIDNVLYYCLSCGKVWDSEKEEWVEFSDEIRDTVDLLRIQLREKTCEICDPSQIMSCS